MRVVFRIRYSFVHGTKLFTVLNKKTVQPRSGCTVIVFLFVFLFDF